MKASFRLPLAISLVLPFFFATALAQSKSPASGAKGADKATAAADKTEAAPAKQRAKPRGRLPAHYNKVIDGQQREKIYAIQQEYEPKITALKAELQALQDKLDAEIEAVLTADQVTKVRALTEEAKQKRKNSAKAASPANADSADDGDNSDEAADPKANAGSKAGK